MPNASWLCFDCRRVMRRPVDSVADVRCPRCGQPCRPIGGRIPVPPRGNARAWEALRESLLEADREGPA